MKRCTAPLVIRDMQIRTTMRYNEVLFYAHFSGQKKKKKYVILRVADGVHKAEILIHE